MKDILRIPSAMVFTAGFNRPNLHYSVRSKPETTEENLDFLVNLIHGKFAGCSGIIYSTTIKEVESLCHDLKGRGVRKGVLRSQSQEHWERLTILKIMFASIGRGHADCTFMKTTQQLLYDGLIDDTLLDCVSKAW